MSIEMESTPRGFGRGKFRDAAGQPCSIQESSDVPHIWLGVDDRTDLNTGELLPDSDNHRMKLTRDMAEDLISLLRHFVETGGLP